MSKNASILILNELKNKRDEVEKEYQKLKNKKVSKLNISIYTLGIIATLISSMILLSKISMALVGITTMTYVIGIPVTYFGVKASKELKLENELTKYNRKIDKLELEIFGINVNHHYIDNPEQYLIEEKQLFEVKAMPESKNHAYIMNQQDASSHSSKETVQEIQKRAKEFEENNLGGPKLSLKK